MIKHPTPEPPTSRPPIDRAGAGLFFWLVVVVIVITTLAVSLVLWAAFIALFSGG